MTKRRNIFVLVVCLSISLLAVKSLSQTRRSSQGTRSPSPPEKSRNKTPREKELEKIAKEKEKEVEEMKKKSDERLARLEEAGKDFGFERMALGVTEEQWKVIKPKLEKVHYLRQQARMSASMLLIASSTGTDTRTGRQYGFTWRKHWEGKSPNELTEGEKIAEELIKLVESEHPDIEKLKVNMDGLRRYRQQAGRELLKARQELRDGLTAPQLAVLVLRGGWFD